MGTRKKKQRRVKQRSQQINIIIDDVIDDLRQDLQDKLKSFEGQPNTKETREEIAKKIKEWGNST